MSYTERTSVSGTALSYLLKECISSSSRQEGFLFGNVTENVTNHISDSRTDNARIDIIINVTSMLPIPESGLFYSPSGAVKEHVLGEMLGEVSGNIVGWYHFRQNNLLKPTLRDKLISKSLFKYFNKRQIRYFMFCSITSKQSLSNSTHTYSYRFYKVNRQVDLEPLVDLTNNLGENVSGYKRTQVGDKNDEFNKAVMDASKDGSLGVAEAVRITLEKAASDAAVWEAKSRELASDINCMLAMLANHYQTKQSNMSKSIIKSEEQQVIKPLVDVITTPTPKRPEPFDFVNDIIKNNLKPNTSESKSCNNFTENINSADVTNYEAGDGSNQSLCESPPPQVDKTKSNNFSPNWDLSPSILPSSSSNTHHQISDT